MKRLFIILGFLFSLVAAQAQVPPIDTSHMVRVDSSSVPVNITLPDSIHYMVIDFLDNVKDPAIAKYVKQVVANTDSVYNPAKNTTVNTVSSVVPFVYRILSYQREGVVAQPNQDAKKILLPQVYQYGWIVQQIQAIDSENSGIRSQRTLRGWKYCWDSKY